MLELRGKKPVFKELRIFYDLRPENLWVKFPFLANFCVIRGLLATRDKKKLTLNLEIFPTLFPEVAHDKDISVYQALILGPRVFHTSTFDPCSLDDPIKL